MYSYRPLPSPSPSPPSLHHYNDAQHPPNAEPYQQNSALQHSESDLNVDKGRGQRMGRAKIVIRKEGDYSSSGGVTVLVPNTMDQLMDLATKKLRLDFAARHLATAQGRVIDDPRYAPFCTIECFDSSPLQTACFRDLEHMMVVYASKRPAPKRLLKSQNKKAEPRQSQGGIWF